jgi:hypothetical protein
VHATTAVSVARIGDLAISYADRLQLDSFVLGEPFPKDRLRPEEFTVEESLDTILLSLRVIEGRDLQMYYLHGTISPCQLSMGLTNLWPEMSDSRVLDILIIHWLDIPI